MLTPEQVAKGRPGEQAFSSFLLERGWYVIPSYDYSGPDDDKPPRMQGYLTAHPIPDLDLCRDGYRCWLEVKTKSEPTFHRVTQTWEHGFSLRLFRHYEQVERRSGTPVFIGIYELNTRALLVQQLRVLQRHARVYTGNKMDRGGTVFFPRDRFVPVGVLS